ncbi:putative phosphatidylinositol-glycan biosynthesis class S protein [Paratrimastix pyriformis]|uniref:Phosphatidylinositol-glycan biosynthesis class S protein n=1 Tax=Paratrimastix pyriformis TaxID=342808 RepID=A0ABQ8UCV0_9EUKA|nr:putative phosphatidylinositol-glycan biosynthesis class S protein [Paratrimastix pyriformis]
MKSRHQVLVAFAVFLLAGLPIWFYLMRVPRDIGGWEAQIQALHGLWQNGCRNSLRLAIVCPQSQSECSGFSEDNVQMVFEPHCLRVSIVQSPVPVPSAAMADADLDDFLRDHVPSTGQDEDQAVTVFLLPMAASPKSTKPVVKLGKYQHGWVAIAPEMLHHPTVMSSIADQLGHLLMRDGMPQKLGSIGYQEHVLAFGLVHATAHRTAAWDFDGLAKAYLAPLLARLAVVANFTLSSQVLYNAPATQRPRLQDGDAGAVLSPDLLRNFVNRDQWDLALPTSVAPTHRFVAYVPGGASATAQQPADGQAALDAAATLTVVDETGRPVPNNGFLVPRWGGVVIVNLPPDAPAGAPLAASVQQAIMGAFVGQLRAHLGLQPVPLAADGSCPACAPEGLSLWEETCLARARALEAGAEAANTLTSFLHTVRNITVLPVTPAVSDLVQRALEHLTRAEAALLRGAYHAASREARSAVALAHQAYFHQGLHPSTMLMSSRSSCPPVLPVVADMIPEPHVIIVVMSSMSSPSFDMIPNMIPSLYFPPNHSYAVYSPFFLPLYLTVALKCVAALREWRAGRRGGPQAKKSHSL